MKLLLFLLFSVGITEAFAQTYEFKWYGTPRLDTSGKRISTVNGVDDATKIDALKKYLEKANAKSGVVALSQDNMPCVVPNTKLMNTMPNAWRQDSLSKGVNSIPNPAKPKRPWTFVPIRSEVAVKIKD